MDWNADWTRIEWGARRKRCSVTPPLAACLLWDIVGEDSRSEIKHHVTPKEESCC